MEQVTKFGENSRPSTLLGVIVGLWMTGAFRGPVRSGEALSTPAKAISPQTLVLNWRTLKEIGPREP